MSKTLDSWILELKEQFREETLTKHVARAKITIGLLDVTSGEVEYHALEYIAKKQQINERRTNGTL
jgi:hypothetical protein